MNIASTGAANIRHCGANIGGANLWQANQRVVFVWDGVGWEIVNPMVRTAMIADGAVTTAKIADNAVTTAKIANGAITTEKFAQNVGFGMRRREWWVPGTYTWTVPSSLPIVEVVGGIGRGEIFITGCGGGGSGAAGQPGSRAGAGGGGGDCIISMRFLVVPGDVLTIIVGSGGQWDSQMGAVTGGATVVMGVVTLLGGGGGGAINPGLAGGPGGGNGGSGSAVIGGSGGGGGGSFGGGGAGATNASNGFSGDVGIGATGGSSRMTFSSTVILGRGGSGLGRSGEDARCFVTGNSSLVPGCGGTGAGGGGASANPPTGVNQGANGGDGFIRIDY